MIVTRFAPSPTGAMHVGNARTALFNYLYARHNGGRFLLRIEDTDRARSTKDNIQVIYDSLKMLGLSHDGAVVLQSENFARHKAVVDDMLARDMAYKAYDTKDELDAARKAAKDSKRNYKYDGVWKNADHPPHPDDMPYVVRIRNVFPANHKITINDLVQGVVTVNAGELDDFIILRSDGTPTYLLSVVVDDNDAGVNTIIRGDDHLTNTFRQYLIYHAMNWPVPNYGHLPLLHGADGTKLSKRHGAMSVNDLYDLGFDIDRGLVNYLATLGWSPATASTGSDATSEFYDLAGLVPLFDISRCGRGASRFDIGKLTSVNAHWNRTMPIEEFSAKLSLWMKSHRKDVCVPTDALVSIMPSLPVRSKTFAEAADMIAFLDPDIALKAIAEVRDTINYAIVASVMNDVLNGIDFSDALASASALYGINKTKVAGHVRLALTGQKITPPMHDVINALGPKTIEARIR